MAGFEYQRETVAKGSLLRRIFLFGAIGLLTCGSLWLLAPVGEKKTPAPSTAAAGDSAVETPSAVPEQNAGESSAERTLPASGGETGQVSESEAEPAETPPESTGSPGAEAPAQAATAIPEKDRPWIGDVPAAEDAPFTPPDRPEQNASEAEKAGESELGEIPYSASWRKQAKALTEKNWSLVSGKDKNGEELVSHKVVSGDSLSRLSARYHCTAESIRLCNGLKNDRIRLGMTLKIVPGPWRVEVSKSARILKVYRIVSGQEVPFLAFDAGIGRLGKTPTADFVVCARLRHPAWYAPDGKVYPYGDAGNPLGDYFLKLAAAERSDRPLRGFGIHGTRDEAGVTRSRSNGCIRMRNRDVERLYQLLPVGTPVKIVD